MDTFDEEGISIVLLNLQWEVTLLQDAGMPEQHKLVFDSWFNQEIKMMWWTTDFQQGRHDLAYIAVRYCTQSTEYGTERTAYALRRRDSQDWRSALRCVGIPGLDEPRLYVDQYTCAYSIQSNFSKQLN